MVSNHSQMKKAFKVGTKFKMLSNWRPQNVGQVRVVTKVQSNAIYSAIDGDPDHRISKSNGGLGYYMPFGKASEWSFEDGVCYWSNKIGDTFYSFRFIDDDEQTPDEQLVLI